MSDYSRIDREALDRHITGNYGEDQFKNEGITEDIELLAEKLYKVFTEKHQKVFDEWNKKHPFSIIILPHWNELDVDIRTCWIAVAEEAVNSLRD